MYLFGRNANGTASGLIPQRIYNFRVYNNNELILDYVPVIRKSDNKPGMLDLAHKTNNLFDKYTYTFDKYYTATGEEDNGNYGTFKFAHSDFISVSPNTSYTISMNSRVASDNHRVIEWDSNHNFIQQVYNLTGKSGQTSGTFTTSNNVKYITINYVYESSTTTNPDINIMLNEGTTSLPYEPYGYKFYTNAGTDEFITGPEI